MSLTDSLYWIIKDRQGNLKDVGNANSLGHYALGAVEHVPEEQREAVKAIVYSNLAIAAALEKLSDRF